VSGFAPGSLVVVRDEEWLIRTTSETQASGTRLEVTGVSGLVRDRDATFFIGLEPPDSIEVLDPSDTRLVPDDTPGYRRSRLWLEALIKRSPLPVTDTRIAVGHRALLDRMDYQLRPAERAMKNLRPRILIGDAVGLGKTLEIGILLQELARRGRAERVLVVTPRAVLEQFQHEMWTRFAFPLVRLDSDGIQKIRQTLPSSRNPFSYYRRVICSIDTLKNPARYKHHLENHRWDVVVIDECHSLINRSTLNNQLAELLARQTDALILASATPHNGQPESFAELVRLLDPTAITDPTNYTAKDIEHLYVRRHRNSPDVAVDVAHNWKARAEPQILPIVPTPAEEEVLRELHEVWLRPPGGRAPTSGPGRTLFPWTLFKAFLSSPVALRSTIARRIENLEKKVDGDDGVRREVAALRDLDVLTARVDDQGPSKLGALVDHLRDIGVGRHSDARAVVFSERVQTLSWLGEAVRTELELTEKQVGVLHAQLPDRQLQQLVEDFSLERSPLRVLLASDMASEGLNLHRQCHHLVHYDLP
jgi:SNF2 family DNA or RNA helicase